MSNIKKDPLEGRRYEFVICQISCLSVGDIIRLPSDNDAILINKTAIILDSLLAFKITFMFIHNLYVNCVKYYYPEQDKLCVLRQITVGSEN